MTALNCVANGRLLREGPYQNIWIQPAAGDAGGAAGAAAVAWHGYDKQPRTLNGSSNPADDRMRGSYLGPGYSPEQVQAALDAMGARYSVLEDDRLYTETAKLLAKEKVIGWFQGRMEFGPRALGGRSIIGDPRSEKMQSVMNLKIKYRESFRPFAPSVLWERVADYFDQDSPSPYMLIVAPVREDLRTALSNEQDELFGIEKLHLKRSELPAITHVDYSARVQTVHKETNPRFHELLSAFEQLTGCGVLVNTSFNVRGEPIVCTPADAYRCFMRTEMDAVASRHSDGKKVFDQAGRFAPAFGMIGTLIGLVNMLSSLEDPTQIGAGQPAAAVSFQADWQAACSLRSSCSASDWPR